MTGAKRARHEDDHPSDTQMPPPGDVNLAGRRIARPKARLSSGDPMTGIWISAQGPPRSSSPSYIRGHSNGLLPPAVIKKSPSEQAAAARQVQQQNHRQLSAQKLKRNAPKGDLAKGPARDEDLSPRETMKRALADEGYHGDDDFRKIKKVRYSEHNRPKAIAPYLEYKRVKEFRSTGKTDSYTRVVSDSEDGFDNLSEDESDHVIAPIEQKTAAIAQPPPQADNQPFEYGFSADVPAPRRHDSNGSPIDRNAKPSPVYAHGAAEWKVPEPKKRETAVELNPSSSPAHNHTNDIGPSSSPAQKSTAPSDVESAARLPQSKQRVVEVITISSGSAKPTSHPEWEDEGDYYSRHEVNAPPKRDHGHSVTRHHRERMGMNWALDLDAPIHDVRREYFRADEDVRELLAERRELRADLKAMRSIHYLAREEYQKVLKTSWKVDLEAEKQDLINQIDMLKQEKVRATADLNAIESQSRARVLELAKANNKIRLLELENAQLKKDAGLPVEEKKKEKDAEWSEVITMQEYEVRQAHMPAEDLYDSGYDFECDFDDEE